MQRIVRIDFRQLLLDLAAAGMSPVDVAAELTHMLGERVAPSTPYRWLDGSTPLHPHGAALLILHSRRIRQSEIKQAHPRPARALAVPFRVGALSLDEVDRAVVRDREDFERSTVVPRHRATQRRK